MAVGCVSGLLVTKGMSILASRSVEYLEQQRGIVACTLDVFGSLIFLTPSIWRCFGIRDASCSMAHLE